MVLDISENIPTAVYVEHGAIPLQRILPLLK